MRRTCKSVCTSRSSVCLCASTCIMTSLCGCSLQSALSGEALHSLSPCGPWVTRTHAAWLWPPEKYQPFLGVRLWATLNYDQSGLNGLEFWLWKTSVSLLCNITKNLSIPLGIYKRGDVRMSRFQTPVRQRHRRPLWYLRCAFVPPLRLHFPSLTARDVFTARCFCARS